MLVVFLGLLYVAAGVAETVRLVVTDDGGIAFWFGTLVGGGMLILVGEALHTKYAGFAAWLIGGGSMVGVAATWWTLVVPVLAVAVLVLALARLDDGSPPPVGQPPEAGAA